MKLVAAALACDARDEDDRFRDRGRHSVEQPKLERRPQRLDPPLPEGRPVPVLDALLLRDDVREVRQGFECGIGIKGFADTQVGDSIMCYALERV